MYCKVEQMDDTKRNKTLISFFLRKNTVDKKSKFPGGRHGCKEEPVPSVLGKTSWSSSSCSPCSSF